MHQQIRTPTTQSPADLGRVLKVIADAGINVLAAGGSNVEAGGEFAFGVADADEERTVAVLAAAGYTPRLVDVHTCYLANRPGELHRCVAEAARANRPAGRVVIDIAIGVQLPDGTVPVQIYSAPPPSAGAGATGA